MRLHLDTNSLAGAADLSGAQATEKTSAPSTSGSGAASAAGAGTRDSVAVSGASSAWSASFSDRAARVGQLAAAVQNGSYHVSSAAVSQSIVASAIS